jgi:hypothetical protein
MYVTERLPIHQPIRRSDDDKETDGDSFESMRIMEQHLLFNLPKMNSAT